MIRKSSIILATLLASIAWTAHAQSVGDLTGTWNLTATASFGPAKGTTVDCQFTGQAEIMQAGSTFDGPVTMNLSGGSQRCPVEMDATITDGTVANGSIQLSLLMGPLGTAQFIGQSARKGQALNGGYSVTSGNFTGTSGSWTAVFAGTPSPQIVPATGAWALALLVLLTVVAGTRFLARRPT